MSWTVTDQLVRERCPTCNITYAVPRSLLDRRDHDGGHWFCPIGHQVIWGENEAVRLRKQLAAEQRRSANLEESLTIARADATDARADATDAKRKARAAQRRASQGVCPVPDCHRRQFDNLAAHMRSKHPGFVQAHSHQADRPAAPTGPTGTMRAHRATGKLRYLCRCGLDFPPAGGAARRHAATCPKAHEPWPAKGETP
jgi:hypothetical protein